MKRFSLVSYLLGAFLFAFIVSSFAVNSAAPEVRKIEGNPEIFWEQFSWTELNPTEQWLWNVLGWNEQNWEDEEADPPASEDKDWAELTDWEREAAKRLGYDAEIWDASE